MDGFVQILARRGAQVTTWSSELVDELFDAQLALEVRAAALAARRAQHDLGFRDELDESVRTTKEALAASDSMMRAVTGRLTWMFHLTSQNDQTIACAEHETILEAIYSGNERLAEARVYAHTEAGRAPSMATARTAVASTRPVRTRRLAGLS